MPDYKTNELYFQRNWLIDFTGVKGDRPQCALDATNLMLRGAFHRTRGSFSRVRVDNLMNDKQPGIHPTACSHAWIAPAR